MLRCTKLKSKSYTNGNAVTLLSVPQRSLRPGAGRHIRDGGTRSREQEVEQQPSHTQTHKQQVQVLFFSECKAAKKLLNALISNLFLLLYHRIMGKNSATSNIFSSSFLFCFPFFFFRAAFVNPLKPEGPEEEKLFQEGEGTTTT